MSETNHKDDERVARKDQTEGSTLYEATVRECNAKAELLEAQARDIRAQAAHREQATRANEIILGLQKLQVERDIKNFNAAVPNPN